MTNLISRLCGKISSFLIKEYKDNNGFKALEKVLFNMKAMEVIDEVINSNLKGRGGAAFPTGLKWLFVTNERSDLKYVICNVDEGEPGTFKDKILLDGCPFK